MRFTLILASTLAMASFAIAAPKVAPAKKAAQIAEGKKVFETNCAMCHGPEGKGDGAAAAALNPKPRNLADAVYIKSRPVDTLRKVITEGGQSVGLSPVMMAWKTSLTPVQIDNVLEFVLTLSTPPKAKKAK
jgi:mono/diheme cytochrome c family protein